MSYVEGASPTHCEVKVKESNFAQIFRKFARKRGFGLSSSEINIFGYTDSFFMLFFAIGLISPSDCEKIAFIPLPSHREYHLHPRTIIEKGVKSCFHKSFSELN